MRTPVEWGRPAPVLGTHQHFATKIHENLWFYSDYGIYFLSITDIHQEIKKAMIETVRAVGQLLLKTVQDSEEMVQAIAKGLAKLEIFLPTYFCTSSIHYLIHLPEKFKDHGAFWAVYIVISQQILHIRTSIQLIKRACVHTCVM